MIKFCWQWSQNVHLVHTMKNQNSFPYMRCFVTMVTQQKNCQPMDTYFLTAYPCYRNMLHIANYSEFELYLPDEYFETIASKIGPFGLFDPCRAKKMTSDLFINNYETVRRRQVKPHFFWIVITRGICWYGGFLTTLKQLLNLTPVQTILWPPGFLYRMWPGSNMKWWSLDPYQHNEIIKPFVSFQLSKLS